MPAVSDKDVIARLPRTFGPALNQQLRQWDLLFPAERRLIRAQLAWISRQSDTAFQGLFEPITRIESRMNLPKWKPDAAALSIEDTAIIARSPYYPEWRAAVEKVFERMDIEVESAGLLLRFPRLLLCILPSGVPVHSQTPWRGLDPEVSFEVKLASNFGIIMPNLVRALALRNPTGVEHVEATWALDAASTLSTALRETPAVVLSWDSLSRMRREFSTRLNSIRRSLRSADETAEDLKRMDLAPLIEADLTQRPDIREFVRALLLSGNGGLVYSNSFVEWGAAETLRRAQPQVLIAGFGIRTKPKPFSSVVWLEDQTRANPFVDQPDPEGSLVDAAILAQYVYLAAQRLAAYRGWTLTMLAAPDLASITVIEPVGRHWPLRDVRTAVSANQLTEACLEWLSASA